MHVFGQTMIVTLAGGLLALAAAPARAAVAGTGTATVQVDLDFEELSVTATFADQVGDLPGVNLGTLAPFSALGVVLSTVNVGTGADFEVPFANGTDTFTAVGSIACPAGGCLAFPGPFAFVGFLDPVDVDLLPDDLLYTFDGSVSCAFGSGVANCSGPFALNAFEPAPVPTGSEVTITGSHPYFDPRLGVRRELQTRVTLNDVSAPGTLEVAGLSRVRGAIPQPYLTSTDGFEAIFFDIATQAIFTNAEVCVVVDADRDGVVDGTDTATSRLAGLHYVGNTFVLENIRLDDVYACLTVTSLSPFALVASPAGTTTTTTPTTSTTSTTAPGTTPTTTPGATSTTTTTIPPCASARACLAELKGDVECPEGLPASLGAFIDRKVRAATTKLGQAGSKPAAKAAKLTKQARAAVQAIDKKAAALAKKKKKGISAACRQSVGEAVAPVLQELAAGRL